jgi:hypothetical protein
MEDHELADHVAELVAAQVAQQLQLLGVQGNVAAAPQPGVPHAAAVKLPSFWLAAPEAWFGVAEAQFELRHVADEKTRYYHVLAALPEVTVRAIADLVGGPVPEDAYTQVKRRLLATHALTEFQRLEKLLQLQQLGAQRPSELLADMLQLCPAGESATKLFRMLFLQRMPRELRIILAEDAVSELQQLAARADVLWTHHGGAGGGLTVAAVSPVEETDGETSTVAAVGGNPPRGKAWKWRGRPGRARGGRQPANQDGGGPSPPDGGKQRVWLCSQHYQNGKGAQSCTPPCAWPGN